MKYLNRIINIEKNLPNPQKDLKVVYLESKEDEAKAKALEEEGFEVLRVEYV